MGGYIVSNDKDAIKYECISAAIAVPGVCEYVSKRVEQCRNYLIDYVEIEYRIFRELGLYIKTHLKGSAVIILKDVFRILRYQTELQISDRLKRLSAVRVDNVHKSSNDIDGIVNVVKTNENDVKSLNEKIAILSEGDSNKAYILEAWSFGLKSSEIARELSLLNGKSFNTNEMYIKRYKRTCQNILTNAA